MTSRSKTTKSARFETGSKVRVKSGAADPDYDDIPLGGSTGTITEIDREDDELTVEVAWDERTLATMHPVFR